MTYLKRKNKEIVVILILTLLIVPFSSFKTTRAEDPEPFFSIAILCPETYSWRVDEATLIAEQLPKIGINVSVLNITGWSEIVSRTWGHQGPYPIPSYSEGGYDLLVTSWNLPLMDWNPEGLFETESTVPFGDNFYQYSSQDFDLAFDNYMQSYDPVARKSYAEEMQEILYNDLPQITIFYDQLCYPHDLNFDTNSWDEILWGNDDQSMENWSIPAQTEFHYAMPYGFSDFHIYTYSSSLAGRWLHQIYDGLAARNPLSPYNRAYTPNLAVLYTSLDGLTYNVLMNPIAKFADGHVLNASDVEYSYQLIIDSDLDAEDLWYWDNHVAVDSVTIIDEFEVDITFKTAYAFQDSILRLPIMPKHIWEGVSPQNHESQAGTWASTNPSKIMGAGPYYLYDYDTDTTLFIHLKRNDYYDDWSGVTPYFEDVYFRLYSSAQTALSAIVSGTIDMADGFYDFETNDLPGTVGYSLIGDGTLQELAINNNHPYLGTGELCPIAGAESAKHVRKAISHIIPRQQIIDNIMNGSGRLGVTACPSISYGFDESLEPHEFSIDLAKAEMEAAGFCYTDCTTTTEGFSLSLPLIFGITIFTTCMILLINKKKRKK